MELQKQLMKKYIHLLSTETVLSKSVWETAIDQLWKPPFPTHILTFNNYTIINK